MANRAARRRQHALFRRAQIESIPKANVANQLQPLSAPCDWPGCQEEWMFATHATIAKVRKVVARRCQEHRLSSE